MIKKKLSLDVLKVAEKVIGYKSSQQNAIMTLKDGSRITTKLYIFTAPEGQVLVNLSGTQNTLEFEDAEEFKKYAAKKFEMFKSEKQMYMSFTGMTEETWNIWNGEGEGDL